MSVIIFVLFLAALIGYSRNTFLGARIIAAETAEEYWGQEAAGRCPLIFMGEALPRNEASFVTFFPQSAEVSWWQGQLEVGGPDNRLYFVQDEYMEQKREAIRQNHVFRYLVLNRDGGLEDKGYLSITGLPMVSWRLDDPVDWDEIDGTVLEGEYSGQLALFDPEPDGQYQVVSCRMDSNMRGNTARYADKKSFRVRLLDEEGRPFHAALCGLREDDDWILNALAMDGSRIREKTAIQLWNELAAANPANRAGTRMTYVELTVDGQYLGLYGLQEPVDKKQLQAGEGDILYKSGGRWPTESEWRYILSLEWQKGNDFSFEDNYFAWQYEEEDFFYHPISWSSAYVKLGKHVVKLEAESFSATETDIWGPLYAFSTLMRGQNTTLTEIEALCDRSNLADMELFRQVIFGVDNINNNMYYYAHRVNEGWQLIYIPWDMDKTFGNGWDICPNDGTMNSTAHLILGRDVLTEEYLLDTLLPATARQQAGNTLLLDRWYTLRKGLFSDEHLTALLAESQSQAADSGALQRDQERWPWHEEGADSLEEIQEFILLRLDALDEYYLTLEGT